jgi:hypothetical protein
MKITYMKRIYIMKKKSFILFFVLLNSVILHAQDDKVKFGAYSRAYQQHGKLGEEDTLNVDNVSNGHVLVDLGLNINPDRKTEIQTIMRFRSELGGFYGGGAQAFLRQAYVRGIIGNFLNYQVGDIYFQLTPFTFFNNYAEGSVNEARIFSDIRRDYTYYENLNRGTMWWQQGAYTNYALKFDETFIQNIRFDAFVFRNRTGNGFSIPTALHAGGKVTITQSENLKIAGNYVNFFEIAETIGDSVETSNPVTSFELDYRLLNNSSMAVRLFGEGGFSKLNFKGDTVKSKSDIFFEVGAGLDLKSVGLTFNASYLYTGPEFFSAGAQSKRVNFAGSPLLFPFYGNDPVNPYYRSASIFDLVRDPSLYNPVITTQLMAYDPTLSNAQPYGKATPNRSGILFNTLYKDSLERVGVDLSATLVSDVAGEGSKELRKFLVLKASVDLNIHKFIGFEKTIKLTGGYKFEKTSRGGDPLEKVDLSSNLIDAGLELEVLKKLDLLAGAKMLMAKGNEFIPVRDQYNNIYLPVGIDINSTQTLLALGLKYRFSANTYITAQNHMFNLADKKNELINYSINHFLIMFNMNF